MQRTHSGMRLVVGAVSLLLVAGCGNTGASNTAASSTGPTSATSATANKCKSVALVVGVTNNPFYTSMERGAKATADELGVTLTVDGSPEWSPAKQTPIVNAVIARHPDVLVLVATDPVAMDPIAKAAIDAGIVVVTADTDIQTPANRIINYASDNVEGGKIAGETLLQLIGGKGKVFLLNAIPGETTTVDRGKGFEGAIDAAVKSGAVTYLPVQFSQEDQVKGTAIVSAVLQANPDLAGIFAEDTINGQAAAVAVKNAGLSGKVKVVAFDASPGEVDALKAGDFQALIGQKPYDMGGMAVKAGCDAVNGNTSAYTGQVVHTDYVVMTPQNITDPNISKYAYPLNE
jgi:ribose transport system substrate-binding protein